MLSVVIIAIGVFLGSTATTAFLRWWDKQPNKMA